MIYISHKRRGYKREETPCGMPAQMIYFKKETWARLKAEENMSALVNSLVENYYDWGRRAMERTVKSAAVLEEARRAMEDQEELSKVRDWLDAHFNHEEYKEGIKGGLWNSQIGYARTKLGSNH